MEKEKIVLAYSGGLDTSVMLKWLKENYDAEVITVTVNLGQESELVGLEEKALATGASKSYIFDLQNEFVQDYAWKSLKGSALYENKYPMATAIGRPLIAKTLVEVARKENAKIIAHGCTGKGNDQVRIELGIKSLDPDIEIIAPVRDWEFKSREEEIDYAIEKEIPVSITKKSPYSIDENIWGIAIECGEIENPEIAADEDVFMWTKNPQNASERSEEIAISFHKGVPVTINNVFYSPVEIVKALNEIGNKHGIGRLDMMENRIVGIKSREIYEAPAAVILHEAHYEMEKLTLDKDTFRFKQTLAHKYANMIYDGLWFTPLFEAMSEFIDKSQECVTGEIKLSLFKGNITVVSRKSGFSLYDEKLATYSEGDSFNHKDAEGFINLSSLPFAVRQKVTLKNAGKFNAVEM